MPSEASRPVSYLWRNGKSEGNVSLNHVLTGLAKGHKAMECENLRKLDYSSVPDKTVEEAWADIKAASEERDVDDFRAVRAQV